MMKTSYKIFLWSLLFVASVSLSFLYIATHNVPVLHPKGLIAVEQRNLLVLCTLLMCIVVVPVLFLTVFFSWRYRETNEKAKYTPDWGHNYLAEIIWWSIPFAIIIVLASITWISTHALNPFKPIDPEREPIKIQAIALDWKWLFIYPDQGIATVNYVQFPEKEPLAFEITADAPMNSFWIPALGGQIYAMPAMRTKLHLMANETGEFHGCSANISGKGFAGMYFTAKATSEEEFQEWVDEVKNCPASLSYEEYEKIAYPSEYMPVQYYSSYEEDLFDQIIMKYKQGYSSVRKAR